MKIIGVIPARYGSTRFPGKPLADICGKPMIWWVYNQVIKSTKLNEVYVLTDDDRIVDLCKKECIPYLLTRDNHPDHISRVQEASDMLEADCYVCVNGDEPLIQAEVIDKVIPESMDNDEPVFYGATRKFNDAPKVIDPANIKIVLNEKQRCVYMSRTAIPFPKGTLDFEYNKYVGIECFNKKALDFFVSVEMGKLEKIEDIDHIRFLENNVPLYFTEVDSESISVDTKKDLEYVRIQIKEKIKKGELTNE